jgi:hypothetical protein
MTEKERAPFKSSVTDYAAIRKRLEEIAQPWMPVQGSEHGVSVEKKPDAPAGGGPYYPSYY